MRDVAKSTNRTNVMRDDQLTARHHLLVEYMVHGLGHPSLCTRTEVVDCYDTKTGEPQMRHPKVGEPLDLLAAAEVLRIKRRNARALSGQGAFQRLLAKETQAFREGARARATRRMVSLIDEPGQGKAADRKVQLAASLATLGEMGSSSPSVVINNNVNAPLTAGVVIDLRTDDEIARSKVIEHEDA